MGRAQLAPEARLHVVWRPGSPRAVIVLKRGRAYATLGWELHTDAITLGQWLKNKLYFRRCDLSADGELWGYFVLSGDWDSVTKGAYTVLARPPWLNALLLWPQGSTWGGGLRFADESPLEVLRRDGTRDPIDMWPIPSTLLGRSGWKKEEEDYRKELSRSWSLYKRMPEHEAGAEQHALVAKDGRTVRLRHWQWAEHLDDGRLAWACDAQLYALPLAQLLQRAAEGRELEHDDWRLFDARDLRYKRLRAPYSVETVFVESGDDGPFRLPPVVDHR